MVAIVSGAGLGLANTSLNLLGPQGALGQANLGRVGEGVYVNSATGNLVVQNRDEVVIGRGPDLGLVRTYNSQGLLNDDNGDNWRLGVYRRVYNLTGTVNTTGSTVTRVAGDGLESIYTFDPTLGKYLTSDSSGAYDSLAYDSAALTWTWTDGDTQVTERYDAANGGRITRVLDPDGNGLTFGYNAAGLITQVNDASGETTFLDYSGNNLTQLRTVKSDGQTLIRTRYAYDTSHRLIEVITDLSPEDASITDGKTYTVTYTYDGTSNRVASVTQSDGAKVSFTYEQLGGAWKVKTFTDALGQVTSFAYDTVARTTRVTDPLRLDTELAYDTAGRLTGITSPAVGGVSQVVSYAYDASGNVTSVTDARRNVVTYSYDANGNRTLDRDAAGNTVMRTYGAKNELLTETAFAVPDPDGTGAGQPASPLTTRYAYNAANHLRFAVSAEGRVTEYRYNGFGQQIAAIQYTDTGNPYTLTGLDSGDVLTEAQLSTWVGSADKAKSLRSDSTYDFRGQVESTTNYAAVDAAGNGVVNGFESVMQYVYDQAGNLLWTVDPRGVELAERDTDWALAERLRLGYTVTDAVGVRAKRAAELSATDRTGLRALYTTTYLYDGLGRLRSATDATGRTTLTQYDDANRKTVLTLANGLVTTSTYDAAGRLVSVLQSANSLALGTTHYFYDADGRLRRTEDPTGVKTHVLYDETDRKIGEIDGDGSLTEYRYDENNSLTRTIRYANAVSAGNLASLTDAQGKPTNVTLAAIRPAAPAQDRNTWYAYDSANRLAKSVDELGFVTQNFYDGAGRLTDIKKFATHIGTAALGDTPTAASINPGSDPANDRLSRNFYDGQGKLRGTLDGEGYLVEYKYDSAGQLIETVGYSKVTDASLRASGTLAQLIPAENANEIQKDIHGYTLYNARGQVAGTVDGEGYLTEYFYDAAGNKKQVIRYATKVTYSTGATLASLRQLANQPAPNPQDQVSRFTYPALNQLESETNPEGTLTQHTYDEVGNLTKTVKAVDTSDVRGLNAQYDKQGRLTAELSGKGSALLADALTQTDIDAVWAAHATHYTYDAAGRKTSATDANGRKTLFYYDADSRLNCSINALGEVTQAVYNALGELTQTIRYGTRLSAATLAGLNGGLMTDTLAAALAAIQNATVDSTAGFEYDAAGHLQQTTDARGFTATRSYNAFGEVKGTIAQIDSARTLEQTYAYDRRGLLKETIADPSGLHVLSATRYDAFGRAYWMQDANGNVRTLGYDKLGRVVTTVGPAPFSVERSTTYDAFGRVLTQTDGLQKTTTYSYDTANRTVTVTTPELIVTRTVKNRHGQTISITDGRQNTTTFHYDKNGNLTGVDSADAGSTTNVYDRADRLKTTIVSNVDVNGAANDTVTDYTYDAANRVLTRNVDPGTGHLNLVTRYEYNAKGQAVSVFDAENVETRTGFNLKGEVASVIVDPGEGHLNLKTTYEYDGRGKKLTVTEGAGSDKPRITEYTYDKLGRLTEEKRIDPAGLNATTTYVYDKNNNVTQKTDANGNVTRYAYDAEDRFVYTVNALGGVVKNDYDANGQVTRTTAYYLEATDLAGLTDHPTLEDIFGRVTTSAADETVGHVYDRDGREIYTVDALGGVVRRDYDGNGNVYRSIAYAKTTAPTTALTKTAIEQALGNFGAPGADDRVTRTAYDAANRARFVIDAAGYVKETVYDNVGRITKTIQYIQPVTVSDAPSVGEVAAAVNPEYVAATAANRIDTLYTNPTQPYTYAASAQNDVAAPATQTVGVTSGTQPIYAPPVQPYTYSASAQNDVASPATETVGVTASTQPIYASPVQPYTYSASAQNDVASPATQSVTVTNSGVTNSTPPVQPYTLVASAKSDVASAASQAGTLTVQNTSVLQSANVMNYAWARSGSTLVQTAGMSIAPGYISYGDTTPSQVKATIYRADGSLYGVVYTDVGLVDRQINYSGGFYLESWSGVDNWNGQVNLGTSALPAGNYTVVLEASDSYDLPFVNGHMEFVDDDYFDIFSYDADGVWAYSNTININVGTVVQPTTVSWATGLQPAGTTVSFQYRAAGSTGAYTGASVSVSGSNHQVNLGAIGAGNYEYLIEYRDSYNRVLKSSSGTLTSATAVGDVTTLYDYDAVGNLISVTDPTGATTRTYYDALGRVVASAEPARSTEEGSATTVTPLTTMRLNAFGNVVQSTRYAKSAVKADKTAYEIPTPSADDQATTSFYDSHGNVIRTVDAEGASRYSSYDALGRLAKSWQPITNNDAQVNNAVQVYEYDKVGRQTETTAASIQQQYVNFDFAQVGDTNVVNFTWSEMASWGGGNVLVRVYYAPAVVVVYDEDYGDIYGPGAQTYRDFEISSQAAARGASVSWTGDAAWQVDGVRVWKRDVDGALVLIHDQSGAGATGSRSLTARHQPGTTVAFKYKVAGATAWSTGAVHDMGSLYLADLNGLAPGTYEYQFEYRLPGAANPSSSLGGTFTLSATISAKTGNGMATAWTPAMTPKTLATERVQYNAFGEIVAKGVNSTGGLEYYYDYDNAGHLWRTNDKDGVDKVYLYDVQGKATAEIESQSLILKNYSSASDVAELTADIQRTNTRYDALERVEVQVQQSFVVDATALSMGNADAGLNFSFQGAYWDEDGDFIPGCWIDLTWGDLSALGAGNVAVTVDYVGSDAVARTYTREFTADAAATGVNMTWSDNDVGNGYENGRVTRVLVKKSDASNVARTIFDQGTSGSVNKLISWAAPTQEGTTVTVLRQAGSGAFVDITANAVYMGSRYLLNTQGWAAGSYNLDVSYTRKGESSAYAHSTASLSINGGTDSLTNTTVDGKPATQTLTPTLTQELDRWGNTLSVTDARGYTTDYRYNFRNQLIEEKKPFTDVWGTDGTGTRQRPVTQNFHDKAGRGIGTIDANGNRSGGRYDAAGQLIAEYHADGGVVKYQYDILGRRVRAIDAVRQVTTSEYDRDNRLVKETHPIGYETYVYDEAGNRIRVTNAESETTRYWYDTRGKLIRTQLPGGQQTNQYYDVRGNKIREVNANNDQPTWSYDEFGRLTGHTDLGDAVYAYDYDQAGHLWHQTATRGSRTETTTYAYHANGLLKSITDPGVNGETFYEYDAAGNRTRERYTKDGTVYRDNRVTFDELGRMAVVRDIRLQPTTYKYDANGNRRNIRSDYIDADGALQHIDSWYLYDRMNRIVLSQGALNKATNTIEINSTQGIELQYDANGNRRVAIDYRNGVRTVESYDYDANGRLKVTNIGGRLTSSRGYDLAGRVTEDISYSSPDTVKERRENTYDINGRLKQQLVFDGLATTPKQTVTYTGYDGLGNVTTYNVKVSVGTAYTNYYNYTYDKYDSYKETGISAWSTLLQPGTTTTTNDFNGNIVAFSDRFGTTQDRSFVTDAAGQILQKTENGKTQYYFYANDKPIGSTGDGATASASNFDYNYTPVSPQYPSSTPGRYVVSDGDSLRSIALAVFGDAQLWYLIADANGLHSDADLTVGQQLTIPNRISNLHNDYKTFKTYSPGQVIGDTSPTLPDPPPRPASGGGGGCGGFGMVLMIIVAVVVTYFTAGAALAAMPELGAVGAAMVGAAAGSVASQLVGMATGNVQEFSWGAVATAALSAGVTGGVDVNAAWYVQAAQGAVNSVVTQGINIVMGQQEKFSWKAVAAAAIAAPVTSALSKDFAGASNTRSLEGFTAKGFGADLATGLIKGAANQGVRMIVEGKGKMNWANIAADAFGNALGNGIVAAADQDGRVERMKLSQDKLAAKYQEKGIIYKTDAQGNPVPLRGQEWADQSREVIDNLRNEGIDYDVKKNGDIFVGGKLYMQGTVSVNEWGYVRGDDDGNAIANNRLTREVAGQLAAESYNPTGSDGIPDGWSEQGEGVGYQSEGFLGNSRKGAYRVFVNDQTGEAVIAYKGSNALADFLDDLNPLSQGEKTYDTLKDSTERRIEKLGSLGYDRSSIFTTGHSLGGAMAQSAAVQFTLSGYGFNSLPVSGSDESIARWRGSDRTFTETNTGGDIATTFYSNVLHRQYLDQNPTTLDTGFSNGQVIGLGMTGLFAWAPAAAMTLGLGGVEHMMGSYFSAMGNKTPPLYLPPSWSVNEKGQPVYQP